MTNCYLVKSLIDSLIDRFFCKVTMRFILVIITLFLELALWWYLVELLKRTHFGLYCTSIGNDIVLGVYLASFFVCIFSIIILYKNYLSCKLLSIILVVMALISTLSFAYLNLSGKVGHITKDNRPSVCSSKSR